MVIPQDAKPQIIAIARGLRGGPLHRLLESELQTCLLNLADATDERVVRQMQGRARMIRELTELIAAS
jgi:hypothetical protein